MRRMSEVGFNEWTGSYKRRPLFFFAIITYDSINIPRRRAGSVGGQS